MSDIMALFDQLDSFKIPPVEHWHPLKTIDFDIKIDAAGKWYYQDSLIQRHRVVKLFSTVLRLEEGEYFLVTPPMKYKIQVNDVPFTAVELNVRGAGKLQDLFFRTNMDEVLCADNQHRITVEVNSKSGEPSPYIDVRQKLKAKIVRSVYYQLTDLLVINPDKNNYPNYYGVYSSGSFFNFGVA